MTQKNEFHNLDNPSDGLFRELAPGLTTRIFAGEQAMLSVVTLAPNSQGSAASSSRGAMGRAPRRHLRCASRAARKSQSKKAISGARPATCRIPCAPARKARACSTSSVRRGPNTEKPGEGFRRGLTDLTLRENYQKGEATWTRLTTARPAGDRCRILQPRGRPYAQPSTTTLVVPFPPGGSTDALARLLQPGLQDRSSNATVIVENKPGAGWRARRGTGGARARQTAHSFLAHLRLPTPSFRPSWSKSASRYRKGRLPRSSSWARRLTSSPPMRTSPYKTIGDVIEACRKEAGAVKYASVGVGTLGHLAMTVARQARGRRASRTWLTGRRPRHQ